MSNDTISGTCAGMVTRAEILWLAVSSGVAGALIGGLMLWTAAALTLITGWDYLMAGLQHVGRPRSKGAGAMQP